MLSVDILIPSKGKSPSLYFQKILVTEILNVSEKFPTISVKFIFSFNCSSNELGSFIDSKHVKANFNNSNLGFDLNVFRAISLSTADYIHLLSDNDYRDIDYWYEFFGVLSSIDQTVDISNYPQILIPVSRLLLLHSLDYPNWHRNGTESLYLNATNNTSFDISGESIELGSVILNVSQLSHFIVKRNSELQNYLLEMLNGKVSTILLKSGIPHSIYLIEMFKILTRDAIPIRIKPFLSPCLLTSFPEKQRSNWFYDSTFIGQRNLYMKYSDSDEIPFGVRRISNELSDYLTSFGLIMLVRECYFFKTNDIETWLNSTKANVSNSDHYNPSNFLRFKYKIRQFIVYFLYRYPTFVFRYLHLLLKFKAIPTKFK
jgi:hypothetical protein